MVKSWVIKKKDKYYRSSLRHPETGIVLNVKWVSLLEAKFFETQKQATDLWGNNEPPKDASVVEITIAEINPK